MVAITVTKLICGTIIAVVVILALLIVWMSRG